MFPDKFDFVRLKDEWRQDKMRQQTCSQGFLRLSPISRLLLAMIALGIPLTASILVTSCGADGSGKEDSTKAFTTCLQTVRAGDIIVPAGTYRIAGSIIKSRNQNLIGAGSKASVIQCENISAPCVIVADVAGGVNNYNNSTVENITLQGPGLDNTSVGLYLGGDPSGHIAPKDAYGDGAGLINVRVTGFNRGVVWGNNSWGNKLVRSMIFGNATGLYVPSGLGNSGENIGLTDTIVFNNRNFGLDDHGSFEWMISGSAFDYNGTAIEFFGSGIHAINTHFEQSGGQVVIQPYGTGDLSIRDSTIVVQASSGSDKYILSLWPQNLQISIDNVSIWSNHPIRSFIHASGNIAGTITGLYGNGNRMIHSFSDPQNWDGIKNSSPIF